MSSHGAGGPAEGRMRAADHHMPAGILAYHAGASAEPRTTSPGWDSLASQILAFERHYNAAATPFGWESTRTDLGQLLTRLARHDPRQRRSPWQHDDPRRINGPDHLVTPTIEGR